jgi:hypothetical protein
VAELWTSIIEFAATVGEKFNLTARDRVVEHDVSGYPNPRHRLTPLANDPFVDLWIAPGRCARSLTKRGSIVVDEPLPRPEPEPSTSDDRLTGSNVRSTSGQTGWRPVGCTGGSGSTPVPTVQGSTEVDFTPMGTSAVRRPRSSASRPGSRSTSVSRYTGSCRPGQPHLANGRNFEWERT